LYVRGGEFLITHAEHPALTVTPGQLLYVGVGREELRLRTAEPGRALLLGGMPFGEQLLTWWNFVARTRDEVDAAYDDWMGDSGTFGRVRSTSSPHRDEPTAVESDHPLIIPIRPGRGSDPCATSSSSAGPASTCRPSRWAA
jgi:hypothetical protein